MRFQSTPPVKAATGLLSNCRADIGFQSTPPVKAATLPHCGGVCVYLISIHAAREGGDEATLPSSGDILAISIHAAREGGDVVFTVFQSTVFISIHAAREGGDLIGDLSLHLGDISIHAAREGGDDKWELVRMIRFDFNPRRP